MASDEQEKEAKYWIAIYTKSRAERQVAQRIADYEGKEMESYVPLHRSLRKWSDRKKWVEVPLIASYVFAHVKRKDFFVASHVEGAVGAIKFGGKEAIIPESEIAYLKRVLEEEMEVAVKNEAQLKRGVRARIVAGPLEGHEGMLVSDCKEGNFAVSITGLNVSVVIEVAQDMLEYLPDEEPKSGKKYNF